MAVVRMQASSGDVLVKGLEASRSLVFRLLSSVEQALKNPAIADGVNVLRGDGSTQRVKPQLWLGRFANLYSSHVMRLKAACSIKTRVD